MGRPYRKDATEMKKERLRVKFSRSDATGLVFSLMFFALGLIVFVKEFC